MNTLTAHPNARQASHTKISARRAPGGTVFGSGLFLLVIGAALTHFVFIGLLGFLMMPVVFGCLVIGLIRARNPLAHPALQAGGLLLMLAGAACLMLGAFASVNLAHAAAMHEQIKSSKVPAPEAARWLGTIALWFLPPILWWLGLRLAATWSPSSRWKSCVAILLVPLSATIVFHQLIKIFSITA